MMMLSSDRLDDCVRVLVEAGSPSDVFRGLLDGARTAVPRAAVFLVRQGHVKGWGCVGYPADAVQRQRAWNTAVGQGRLGRLASASRTELERWGPEADDPDFGQPAASEAAGIAVRVKGRAIALMLAERSPGESPWEPGVLAALVRVAQLRLDLDLVRRKLETLAGPSNEPVPPARQYAIAAAPAAPTDAPPHPESTRSLDPVAEPARESLELDSARRFARLVATDIRLYNEEAVILGRKQGDLAARLREPMHRGKETFLRRHGDLERALTVLHDAYVQVLAGGDAALLPVSALD